MARATLENFAVRALRLYEQERGEQRGFPRLGEYVSGGPGGVVIVDDEIQEFHGQAVCTSDRTVTPRLPQSEESAGSAGPESSAPPAPGDLTVSRQSWGEASPGVATPIRHSCIPGCWIRRRLSLRLRHLRFVS